MMVRLVKGAYWDTEIKRAQERGLDGYPVFTRKAMTDLNYVACAQQLLALRPRIFPQFATHNALTVATILELATEQSGFEFQRLHGMGEALYAKLGEDRPDDRLSHLCAGRQPPRSAWPIWCGDCWRTAPIRPLSRSPPTRRCRYRNCCGVRPTSSAAPTMPRIRTSRCRAISIGPQRKNSRGIEFGERAALEQLVSAVAAEPTPAAGSIADATENEANAAIAAARDGFSTGARTPAETRAAALEKAADLLEQRARAFHRAAATRGRQDTGRRDLGSPRGRRFLPLLCRAGTRTVRRRQGDAGTDRREQRALRCAAAASSSRSRRGIFRWRSFWARSRRRLMAGNAVVAKPAEQTPLIAAEAIRLLHEAGVPASALHLVAGDGRIGAALVAHPDIAGVVFTGSTEVARTINRALAAKDGPIVPLIAETGGINAMIVDATALPEQVADDVVTSAFRSAGQRCSALRLLFLQDDVADRMIEMIAGAARELVIGDPARSRHAYRPGDRRRGQAAAGRAYRTHEEGSPGAFCGQRARRQLRRAAYFRTVRCRPAHGRSVRPGAACGALPRRPVRSRCCNRSSAPATG